jgi:phospholipid/cholesterol/gamma-HCH transport system substrate-binding protein
VAGRVDPTRARVQGALETARPLLRRAVPLVARLRPALRALHAAADDGVPLVSELMPVVRRVSDATLPMLERADKGTRRPLYQLIGPLLSVLDSAGSVTDGRGHLISFQGGVNSRSGEGLLPCEAMVTNPTSAQKVTCAQLSTLMAQLLGRQPETMAPQDVSNPGRGG